MGGVFGRSFRRISDCSFDEDEKDNFLSAGDADLRG
jgi:hypothetical protein